MALELAGTLSGYFGSERKLKKRIQLRLIEAHEREKFDEILGKEHYLHNPTAVGAVLRYVVTEKDQWLALLVFCSPAAFTRTASRMPATVSAAAGMRRRSSRS